MSDLELIDAVAQKTGEDSHEIRRRGFVLTGPDDAGPEPECLLTVLLVDLEELGTVDWDSLGYGCRAPRHSDQSACRGLPACTGQEPPEGRSGSCLADARRERSPGDRGDRL